MFRRLLDRHSCEDFFHELIVCCLCSLGVLGAQSWCLYETGQKIVVDDGRRGVDALALLFGHMNTWRHLCIAQYHSIPRSMNQFELHNGTGKMLWSIVVKEITALI